MTFHRSDNATLASPVHLRAAALGFAAGLRSQMPLALLAGAAGRGDLPADPPLPLALLESRWVRRGLLASAVGEAIADKTPFVPSRTAPGPLAGRIVFGALAAVLLAQAKRRPALPALLFGAAGAAAGTFAGYAVRTTIPRETGVPDAPVAVAEDLTALLIARSAVGQH